MSETFDNTTLADDEKILTRIMPAEAKVAWIPTIITLKSIYRKRIHHLSADGIGYLDSSVFYYSLSSLLRGGRRPCCGDLKFGNRLNINNYFSK